MMVSILRWSSILLMVGLIYSCRNESVPEVAYKGALRNAMKHNDLSAYADLEDFKNLSNLYALGALEGLSGEVMVINSIPYVSQSTEGGVKVENSWDHKANFLVYAQVEDWKEYALPIELKTLSQLAKFIEELDVKKPTPFLVEGLITSASWHVVNWDKNDSIHTHEKHIKSGAYDTFISQPVTILGFYSTEHKGIFTHHSLPIHAHVKTDGLGITAHLDEVVFGENMILKLPK